MSERFGRVSPVMPDGPIELGEEPLMGGREDDERALGAEVIEGPADFRAIVLDVFEYVDVEDGVEVAADVISAIGDDIAGGKILANELKYRLREPVERFVADGKLMIGICNGFQVMVKAGLLPDGKVEAIRELQAAGLVTAMVGDGINDAPSLKQADVGIAIGTGTDIAIESADMTLVHGSLTSVVRAVLLSRATFRKIRQNLFWAYFYNTIAIPVAILGLLHPILAEAAMAMSSITVVTNANRLRSARLDLH